MSMPIEADIVLENLFTAENTNRWHALVPHPVNKRIIKLGDIFVWQGARKANIEHIQLTSNAVQTKIASD